MEETNKETIEEIRGTYDDIKDCVLDPNGYFLIRINKENQDIEVGFCKEGNKVLTKIVGKRPQEIYHAVIQKNLTTKPDHLAYLGKECQKAFIALKLNLEYVQDDELDLSEVGK